ncbi:MAG: ABC transporter permease [Chloroflexales bacterium]|nr:ABC transporter permease [Chloroflexales bacterium]
MKPQTVHSERDSLAWPRRTAQILANLMSRYGIVLALMLMCLALSLLSPIFIRPQNLLNVLLQASINMIIAVGMTLVITQGGIDLSVGSIVALSGMITADLLVKEYGLPVAITAGLLTGTLCGWLNGALITFLNLPPFIVTLGTLSAYRGLALIYNSGRPIFGLPPEFNQLLASSLGPVPRPVIIALAVAIIFAIALRYTRLGEYTIAIGGSEEAAHLSGVPVRRYKIAVYAISGLLSGLAATVLAARLSAMDPTAGALYELDAIAATVIGGTSLSGGVGTVFGTVVGALLMSVLRNGMNLLNVQSYYQQLIIGVVIILAVIVDRLRKKS